MQDGTGFSYQLGTIPTCLMFLVAIGIAVAIIMFLSSALQRIPAQYRLIEPNQMWLLLIPLFNIVWLFFVVIRVSKSFQAYFAAQGRTDVGDCGHNIGLAWAICAAVSCIPLINCLAGPASLVLMILFLVKVNNLKEMIPPPAGFGVASTTLPPPPDQM